MKTPARVDLLFIIRFSFSKRESSTWKMIKLYLRLIRRSNVKRIIKLSVIVLSFLNLYLFIGKYSGEKFNLRADDDGKIDWHDYAFMAYEASRTGPGENGAPVKLNETELEETKNGYRLEGIYTIANDKISSQRSLPGTPA